MAVTNFKRAESQSKEERFKELQALEYELALVAFKRDQDLISLARLTASLEKLLTASCYKSWREAYNLFRSESVKGENSDLECVKWRDELGKYLPDSPLLQCINTGLNSKECQNAFATLEVYPKNKEGNNLELALLDEKQRNRQVDLQNRLQTLQQQLLIPLRPTMQEEDLAMRLATQQEIEKSLAELLKISCHDISIGFRILPLQQSADEANSPSNDAPKSLGAAKESVPTTEKENLKIPPNKIQVRMLPPTCFNLIEYGLKLSPKLPVLTCTRYGDYTPQCFRAVVDWQKIRRTGPETKEEKGRGEFKEF